MTKTKKKKNKQPSQFSVVVDTRQKMNLQTGGPDYCKDGGWSFSRFGSVESVVREKLDTGDYAIKGLQNLLCIDRKATVSQIVNNFIGDRQRFFREVQRMKDYKFAFFICEFPYSSVLNLSNYYFCAKSKARRLSVQKTVIGTIFSIEIKHGVRFAFCDNPQAARKYAYNLMRKVYLSYLQGAI